MHEGIDFAAPYGSPVHAACGGIVIYQGPMPGYGALLLIRQGDRTVAAYAHMSRILVHRGRGVHAGQVVALVGSRGYSTGPHLHFEIRNRHGRKVDPIPWLRRHGVRI